MRHFSLLYLLAAFMLFSSCEDVFDTDSTSAVIDKGEMIDNPADTLYSVMGILSQLQKLGERYVLMGELRGDLLTTTSNAASDLQEVAAFNVSEGNVYSDRMDYYAVINNCNFALQRMDTTILNYQTKVMLPEYVAILAMRDWTYWQMALTFGYVRFVDEPLLNLESTLKAYPTMDIVGMAQTIITDLTPYVAVRHLDYGSVDGINTSSLFVPIELFLADVHLFLNNYEQAASLYYDYINRNRLTVSRSYLNEWTVSTRTDATMNWLGSYTGETLFQMAYSSDAKDYHPTLIRLSYNTKPSIVPTNYFVEGMTQRMYFYTQPGNTNVSAYLQGDMRGQAINRSGVSLPASYGVFQTTGYNGLLINKYLQAATSTNTGYDPQNEAFTSLRFTRQIPLIRTSHVYLRFAEAVNRLGKPSMAFAVLKHGLTINTMEDSLKVNPGELLGERFTDFSWSHTNGENENVGTTSRGLGRGITTDTEHYVIGEQESLEDSMLVVENMIVEEMAAETAFEGNRFFDLLRVARHRDAFPQYLAEMVSRRYENPQSAFEHLNRQDAWWVK